VEDEFSYRLKNGVVYAHEGTELTSKTLTLKAPDKLGCGPYFKLQGHVTRAMAEMSRHANATQTERDEAQASPSSGTMTANELRVALAAGMEDYSKFVETFMKLMEFVAYTDTEVRLKPLVIDRISPLEIEQIGLEYVSYFIMPSLLSTAATVGKP
jgi:hypothetical protein